MKPRNKHRGLVLSFTFVGLFCGLVLTHQQAYAAQTPPVSNQQSQITAVAAPNNNLPKTAAVSKTNTRSSTQNTCNIVAGNQATDSNTQINGNSNTTTASSEQPDTNIIAQGTWGTSKWDYTQEGSDYILHLHAGTLGTPEGVEGIGSLDAAFEQQLTQIVIDPGVIANQNSSGLFRKLVHLKTIQGLENLDTSKVTDMSSMFYDCLYLTNLDVNHFDTSQVTDMSDMFGYCTSLINLDLSNFDTSQVTDMIWMFNGCKSLTSLDVSYFNTSQVTNMSGMFAFCGSLTSLDLGSWNTSNVENMSSMFSDCINLVDLNLKNWSTLKVNYDNLYAMLNHCKSLSKLVLGPKTILTSALLPNVPSTGTKIPGTDKIVTAPYWVATSGYQTGQRYTSEELMTMRDRDQATTYEWASQPLFASTVATKAVIRTINVHNPDGTMQTENQIATLTQEIKNNADGTQTLGPWSTGQWQAYAVPEITGYTAAPTEVAAQTVTDSTVNQTIDVYYEPVVQQITVNYLENGKIVGTQILTGYAGETIIPQYRAPKGYEIIDRPQGELTFSTDKQQIVQIPVQAQIIPTSESKVLIRTVNIHLPSGNLKTYRQPVVLTRTVYLNAVSGEKTYDDWSTGHWGAITVPVVAGYTASQAQVAAQTVTAQDSDQLLDIYYTKA